MYSQNIYSTAYFSPSQLIKDAPLTIQARKPPPIFRH